MLERIAELDPRPVDSRAGRPRTVEAPDQLTGHRPPIPSSPSLAPAPCSRTRSGVSRHAESPGPPRARRPPATRDNPVDWWPWGRTPSPRPRSAMSLVRRSGTPPATGARDGAPELRGRHHGEADERAVRQHQIESRGTARRRRHLMNAIMSRGGRRLAAVGVLLARWPPFSHGTYFPKIARFNRPSFKGSARLDGGTRTRPGAPMPRTTRWR